MIRRDAQLQRASLYLIAAVLAWCPFFFGSNRVLPWYVNFFGCLAALVLYLVPVVRDGVALPVRLTRYRWLLAAAALVVLWSLIQLAPLDIDWLSNPVWAHAEQLTGIKRAGRITAAPMLTEYALLRLVTCIMLGWLVLQLAADSDNAALLYRVLLWSGIGYGIYGLIQWSLHLNGVLWVKFPYPVTSLSSTFINRNNAATYFGMISQIALAQLMREYTRAQGNRDWVLAEKIRRIVERKLDVIGRAVLLFLFFAAVVALTDSRAGLVCTLAGWLTVGGMYFLRDRQVGLASLGFATAFVAMLVVVIDTAGSGLAERLFQAGAGDVARFDMYRISLLMIADYPLIGAGNGAWQTIFAIYRDGTIPVGPIYDKAHNTYLELMLGLGLPVALVFLAAYAAAFATVVGGFFRRERNRIYTCVAAAATVQVALHTLVDFSMQIQAIALVHTALLAIGVAQAQSSRRKAA